jgi:hypothetical protein
VEVIFGFPTNAASNGAAPCAPGVQSLFFLDHLRLVAAGGDEKNKPLLRLYDLTDTDVTLKADEFKQDLELPVSGDKPDLTWCLHDFARTQPNDRVADMLVFSASTDRGSAGLWKAPVRANTLGEAAALKVAKDDASIGAAGGVAVGSDGYIVTARRSEPQSAASSRLQYMNPIDGRLVLSMEVKLPRIVGLAYHPTSRNLYAASLGVSGGEGGVFRIDDATEPAKPAATAVKIAGASRPTALSFGPDGSLFVTTFGDGNNDKSASGKLLRFTGEL